MSRIINLEGQIFGKWTVGSYAGSDKNGNALWNCVCECGTHRAVTGYGLKNGTSTSCGCSRKPTEPSASSTPLYRIWNHMTAKNMNCGEWNDFGAFKEWALSNGYTDGLFLERINDDERFCPENCIWLTKEQRDEKRCRLIEIDGTRRTLFGWAKYTQIPLSTLRNRWRAGDRGRDLIRPSGQLREGEQPHEQVNLAGQRFGNWQVKSYAGKGKYGNPLWECQCDCGSIRKVSEGSLIHGTSTSCGCSKGTPYSKHRSSNTRLYNIWSKMKCRCGNENDKSYKDYGGRGISVCDEWSSSFPAFQEWALSHGYQDNLSIDRIDVNGNYCPENCRWATTKEQCNNTRRTIFFEVDGTRKPLTQWAEDTGIPRKELYYRYHHGYSGHDLIRPVVKETKLAV